LFSALGLHSEAFLGQVRDQKIQRKNKLQLLYKPGKRGKTLKRAREKESPKKKVLIFSQYKKFIS